ncbi:MAG: hypothetical protein JRF50_18480, partial [Deltaproteobacteria bacterium]|nr:hypothetical protein [Deltaproteobacteria bacterium]
MAYLTSNDGKKIWYDVVGEGEPLVLIGGSSLVHNQWDFMLPILQDHFKVILYDQRGAGLSDRNPVGIIAVQNNLIFQFGLKDINYLSPLKHEFQFQVVFIWRCC